MKDQVHDLKGPVDKRGDGSDTAKPRDASKRHVTTYGRLLIGQPSLTYKTTTKKCVLFLEQTYQAFSQQKRKEGIIMVTWRQSRLNKTHPSRGARGMPSSSLLPGNKNRDQERCENKSAHGFRTGAGVLQKLDALNQHKLPAKKYKQIYTVEMEKSFA